MLKRKIIYKVSVRKQIFNTIQVIKIGGGGGGVRESGLTLRKQIIHLNTATSES